MTAALAPWLALVIGYAAGWVGNDLRRSWRARRSIAVGVACMPGGGHLHYVRGFPFRTRYVHAVDVCWCNPDRHPAGGTA